MLSLEEQIERIADAAFAQTSAVEWRRPTESVDTGEHAPRSRRWLLAIAAGVLTIGLVGGLIALVDNGRSDPLAPVNTGLAPAPSQPIETVPMTTVMAAPSTTLPAGSGVPVAGAQLDRCSAEGICTYASLNDGRLVRLDSRFKNDELPAATIYGNDRATTVFFDERFSPASAFLLDVGPGDIAYIWWTTAGEESAKVSAFELTGPEAGRLVTQFDASLDPSGDTELVPTRSGFVGVECCGVNPTLPAPDAEVLIPWVERSGVDVVAEDRTVFVITINERLGVQADRPGDNDQSWDVFFGDVAPRGMPFLYDLADGRVVLILDGSTGTGDPIYLLADGETEQVPSPGTVVYVAPDGRFVVRGPDGSDSLIDPNPDTSSRPTPTTTIEANAGSQPSRPLVAVDANGDAVVFDPSDANPNVLFDGPDPDSGSTIGDGFNAVDRISIAADQSVAYIGLCCSPIVGTILQTTPPAAAEPRATPTYGFAPTLNPAAALLAAAGDSSVGIIDVATGEALTTSNSTATWDTAHDLTWLDDTTLAVLGSQARWWSLTIITVDGDTVAEGPTRAFAPFDEFANLRFAGSAVPGEIAMHDVGTNRVISGTIDDYGNHNGRGSSLEIVELPAVAISAWYFDPGQLIWIDTARTLRIGDRTIPGEYLWARR